MTAWRVREVVPGVHAVALGRGLAGGNVYIVRSGDSWVLVDTGWPGSGPAIRTAAASVVGADSPPAAILLTHLHPDHTGGVRELATGWGAPVRVHPDELPAAAGYVPEFANPMDRRVIIPVLDRLPRRLRERVDAGADLTDLVRALDPARPPPGLPDWRCVAVPGHTPGSLGFHRPADGVLVSGDALLTVDLHAPGRVLRAAVAGMGAGPWRLSDPLRFTSWDQAAVERSLTALADLGPRAVLPGHGRPVVGPAVGPALRAVVSGAGRPRRGRRP